MSVAGVLLNEIVGDAERSTVNGIFEISKSIWSGVKSPCAQSKWVRDAE